MSLKLHWEKGLTSTIALKAAVDDDTGERYLVAVVGDKFRSVWKTDKFRQVLGEYDSLDEAQRECDKDRARKWALMSKARVKMITDRLPFEVPSS